MTPTYFILTGYTIMRCKSPVSCSLTMYFFLWCPSFTCSLYETSRFLSHRPANWCHFIEIIIYVHYNLILFCINNFLLFFFFFYLIWIFWFSFIISFVSFSVNISSWCVDVSSMDSSMFRSSSNYLRKTISVPATDMHGGSGSSSITTSTSSSNNNELSQKVRASTWEKKKPTNQTKQTNQKWQLFF